MSEDVTLYSVVDPTWYEDFDRYRPAPPYLSVVRKILPEADLVRSGPWINVFPSEPELPQQGWKIHLSASSEWAEPVLRVAAERCSWEGVVFKFIADPSLHTLVNSKNWSRSASGKFVTIYPRDETEFVSIARDLDDALDDATGPRILSDKLVGESQVVHYRYGGCRSMTRLLVDGSRESLIEDDHRGLVRDERRPYWSPPSWVADPFERVHMGETAGARTVLDGRFEVSGALSFSAAGGVYAADDTTSGRRVVVREARPHIGSGIDGHLATELLGREHDLLERLAETSVTPEPISLFWYHGHRWLAMERIEGVPLGTLIISRSPLWHPGSAEAERARFRTTLSRLWRSLAEGIAAVHAKDVVLGDLSLTNILVEGWETDQPRVRLIDLEGAWSVGETPSHMVTPGFAPAGPREGRSRRDDIFALGRVCLSTLMPTTSLAEIDEGVLARIYRAAGTWLGVPADIMEVLECLCSDENRSRGIEDLLAMLACWEPSLSPPGTPRPGGPVVDTGDITSGRLRQLVDGAASLIMDAADHHRSDRLFPGSAKSFLLNGYGLAHGAAGVLHCLHATGRDIREKDVAWLLSRPLCASAISPGLFVGSAGVGSVLFELGHDELGARLILDAAEHPLTRQEATVWGGAAGVGIACLTAHTAGGPPRLLQAALDLASHVVETAEQGNDDEVWWRDSAGERPLGLAFGAAGVSLFLLYAHLATGVDRYRELGQAAIRTVLGRHEVPPDRDYWAFPSLADTSGRKVFRHYWSDGSAGIGMVTARWLAATGAGDFEDALDRFLPDTQRRITVFPSVFLGMSGIGMFHLDAYRLLGRQDSLDWATNLAAAIDLFTVEREGGIGYPGDQLQRLSCDLASGSAGVMLFLERLRRAIEGEPEDPAMQVVALPDALLRSADQLVARR